MDLTIGKEKHSLWIIPMLAMKYVNVPYIYGGKTPLFGLDCSGLVCELLQSLGVIGTNEELNSQGIYDRLKDKSIDSEITLGSLAFYGTDKSRITHVAMFLDTHFIIEAGHGTSETDTLSEAQGRDAKGRIRPFNYRKDLVAIFRPKFEDFGLHE